MKSPCRESTPVSTEHTRRRGGVEPIPLHCPICLARLVEQADAHLCDSCGRQYALVDGIPVLQDELPYFGEFSREQMKSLLAEATCNAEHALRELLRRTEAAPRLGEYILGEGRSGWRFLLPIHPEAAALDLGCGWGAVAYGLARNCRRVVAMDSTLERMQFLRYRAAQTGMEGIQFVCAGSGRHLPFADRSFDIVVLNGVLEWVPCGRPGDPEALQLDFLKEVRRVLRPTGALYLAIENRYSWKTWFRDADGHTGLRFVTWLPRAVADAYSRLCGAGPYRNYLYGRKGYARLLAQAGFEKASFHVPLPGYHHPTTIVPAEGQREIAGYFARPGAGPLRGFRSRIRGALTSRFPDSFSIIAGSDEASGHYLERLCCELARLDPSLFPRDVRRTLYRINGEMGVVTAVMRREPEGPGFVLKLPLHARGEETLRREATWFAEDRLEAGPLARFRHLLPTCLQAGEFEGQYFAAFRLLPGVGAHRLSGKAGRRHRVLDEATTFAADLHRSTSGQELAWDVWVRQNIESNVNLVRTLTASGKQEAALDRLAEELVQSLVALENCTALGHGDYKLANCLFDANSGALSGVLDWGGGLQRELPLYDTSFLYVDYAASLGLASIGDAIRQWIAGGEPFAGTKARLGKLAQELGLAWSDERYRMLGAYQWLKRMAPLGTGHECRRFDYRHIDGMFEVLAEAGF